MGLVRRPEVALAGRGQCTPAWAGLCYRGHLYISEVHHRSAEAVCPVTQRLWKTRGLHVAQQPQLMGQIPTRSLIAPHLATSSCRAWELDRSGG